MRRLSEFSQQPLKASMLNVLTQSAAGFGCLSNNTPEVTHKVQYRFTYVLLRHEKIIYGKEERIDIMENKHTKGPWEVSKVIRNKIIASKTAITIADCCITNLILKAERDANARLIAAAPDLLEACKLAAKYVAKMVADDIQTAVPPANALDRINKAIEKATK